MNPPNEQDSLANIKKELFTYAMKSNWKKVIELYKSIPEAQNAKITRSGDTALHIAISDGQESTVEELVKMVDIEALRIENDVGNTPLHLAAYLGNSKMCICIAIRDPTLMGIRNEDKETPLFLAVLRGRKDAFHCLNALCKNSPNRYGCSRGRDGDTILHSAINGEYFEIAFQIINDYENLLNSVNENGISPLHILASKPLIFRSGSHLTWFQQLIYNCIFVDEINLNESDPPAEGLENDHNNPKYPENYQTCVGIFVFTRNLLRVLMGRSRGQHDQEEGQLRTKCVPENCTTCFNFVTFLSKVMFVILVLGSSQVERIREKKKKHVWSIQILRKLTEHASSYEYENNGKRPDPASAPGQTRAFDLTLSHEFDQKDFEDNPSSSQNSNENVKEKNETPLLIAAKNGINEMVEEILVQIPEAINDTNTDKKNIVLLAVENRQPHIYKFLQGRKIVMETIFRKTDKDGNSAFHIAAMMGDHRIWWNTNAALQLQWEYKWYQYVRHSMPPNYFARHNNKGETPSEIFIKSQQIRLHEAGMWLKETSTSCSVVAALVSTVSFATSATIPGGVTEKTGTPTLKHEAAFSIFAISSLVALCFSVTSIIMFLAIFTASYNMKEFNRVLQKLLVGLGSLFVSLSAMLVSFCASQFLIMKDQLKYAAVPLYVVIFTVMTGYVIIQFPWYFDVALITLKHVPPRIRNYF